MNGRQSRAALATAGLLLAPASAAVAANDGTLYFVNVTKQAASLAVDDKPRGAPDVREVQGLPITSGPHTLHVAVEGRPTLDTPATFDPDHIAQDETGRTFWCVVAAIDAQQQLRTVPIPPPNCSKLVAMGLHPQPAGDTSANLKGDLYFLNVTGKPLNLTMNRDAPAHVADRQVFGSAAAPGAHDLHLATSDTHSVDVHLNFNARNLAHDSRGMGYWCVGAGTRPNGSLTAYQLEAAKCAEMVALGPPPPAH